MLKVDSLFEGSTSAIRADNAHRTKAAISSPLVKETLERAQIDAIKVVGTFHTVRHTFMCVLPASDPTDGVSLTLDHHYISHGNPLGFYVGVATPFAGFLARLLEYLDVAPVPSPVPVPSMLLPLHAKPVMPANEELVFRREEGKMEKEHNEIVAETGSEYDIAAAEEKKKGRL